MPLETTPAAWPGRPLGARPSRFRHVAMDIVDLDPQASRLAHFRHRSGAGASSLCYRGFSAPRTSSMDLGTGQALHFAPEMGRGSALIHQPIRRAGPDGGYRRGHPRRSSRPARHLSRRALLLNSSFHRNADRPSSARAGPARWSIRTTRPRLGLTACSKVPARATLASICADRTVLLPCTRRHRVESLVAQQGLRGGIASMRYQRAAFPHGWRGVPRHRLWLRAERARSEARE